MKSNIHGIRASKESTRMTTNTTESFQATRLMLTKPNSK
jgi:hypothetical protein